MSHATSALALRIRKYGGAVVNTVTSQQEGTNPQPEFKSSGLSVQFLSGNSGFLRQSKDTHVGLNGDSK